MLVLTKHNLNCERPQLGYTGVMRLTSLSHVIAFIALPLVAHAEPVDECDRLAALEADPSAVSEPVAFIDIKPEQVVKACTDALNAGEKATEPRFLLQRA